MNTLAEFFDWLVASSLRASVLTMIVLALHLVLRRRAGARALYALWLPVLVVLITPVRPESRWSIERAFVRATAPMAADVPARDHALPLPAPVALPPAVIEPPQAAFDWSAAQFRAWAFGSAALMGICGLSFLRTLRRFRRDRQPVSDELAADVARIARDVGLRRVPRVWLSPAINSPAVAGLLRPVLLLPAAFARHFTTEEARLILQHELMHLKRHDLPLNALMCLLIVLHWFNPILWLAFLRARADREAACDAQVLENAPPQCRIEYGHALLKAETAFPPLRLSLGFVGLFQRGSTLRFRIQSIARHRKTHPAMKLLNISCIAIMTIIGATRAATTDEQPKVVIVAKFVEISSEANRPDDVEKTVAEMLADLPSSPTRGEPPTAPPLEGNRPAMAGERQPVIAVLDDAQFQIAIRRLSGRKRIDLMACPSVTTHSGQKATIAVLREFEIPAGQKSPEEKVGVRLEVLPEMTQPRSLNLTLDPRLVEFDGFEADARGVPTPVFNIRSSHARVSVESGQTVLLDLGSRTDKQQVEEEGADGTIISSRTDHFTRRAVVFVTAQVVKPASAKGGGQGSPTDQPAAPKSASGSAATGERATVHVSPGTLAEIAKIFGNLTGRKVEIAPADATTAILVLREAALTKGEAAEFITSALHLNGFTLTLTGSDSAKIERSPAGGR